MNLLIEVFGDVGICAKEQRSDSFGSLFYYIIILFSTWVICKIMGYYWDNFITKDWVFEVGMSKLLFIWHSENIISNNIVTNNLIFFIKFLHLSYNLS